MPSPSLTSRQSLSLRAKSSASAGGTPTPCPGSGHRRRRIESGPLMSWRASIRRGEPTGRESAASLNKCESWGASAPLRAPRSVSGGTAKIRKLLTWFLSCSKLPKCASCPACAASGKRSKLLSPPVRQGSKPQGWIWRRSTGSSGCSIRKPGSTGSLRVASGTTAKGVRQRAARPAGRSRVTAARGMRPGGESQKKAGERRGAAGAASEPVPEEFFYLDWP